MSSPFLRRLYAYKVHHVLLWVSYFAFWIFVYKDFYPALLPLIVATAVYFVFNSVPFYITAYYLFPVYLYRRRYLLFFVLLITLTLTASCMLAASLYFLFGKHIPEEAGITSLLVMASSSIVTVVGVLSGAKLIVERLKSDSTERKLQQERVETELQYLKAQVNPHFLFNAINSVYILIRKDPDMAAETLIKLSDLLRFQLYDCTDEKIHIEKELENIRNFVELEKLRKGERIKVSLQEEGQLSGNLIAPFLLIPFLENAFKYVSNHSDKENVIKISFNGSEERFEASIFNTHDHNKSFAVGGIGLKNVRRRLELLYPGKHRLSIDEKPDSYLVTLSIQLK